MFCLPTVWHCRPSIQPEDGTGRLSRHTLWFFSHGKTTQNTRASAWNREWRTKSDPRLYGKLHQANERKNCWIYCIGVENFIVTIRFRIFTVFYSFYLDEISQKTIFNLLIKVQVLSVINAFMGHIFLNIGAIPGTHFIYFVIFLCILSSWAR